ncbi:beta-ketoacyl-[acyl-carrier-protein] synthase family protein [Paraburkholderia bonniea]|uniref:beta-ketoacyl-[acyl-carrier-protein] synthase family protein n=1 Tax=Paraburkholderia bonniea TaxID=2152891 RepID=UPI001291B82A|nr:beta-ketoacyl synthase N-terminal-like domain-containing protein [Paraburkholderia bonniea]
MTAEARRGLARVVVTGMGIVSCLGNTLDEVASNLRVGRSGITRIAAWRERGLMSQVAGVASVQAETPFEHKFERFMGDTARFACHAARKAIADAGLEPQRLRSPRAGAVVGSGVGAMAAYDLALGIAQARGSDKISPCTVPQVMGSTASASIAQCFGVEGTCYSPSAACTTSALALGQAMQLIQGGHQDLMLAGGSEALHDNTALMFDAMGALSRRFNDTPGQASRPYDLSRDGFVLAAGGGVLVLESLAHARARGARIYAELKAFSHGTDSTAMVAPQASGIARVLQAGVADTPHYLDYINVHAPSTPLGDRAEMLALRQVFGARLAPFSSTKRFSGHSLGACGAHEAIYTLLMMRDGFIAGMGEIEAPDPCIEGLPVVHASRPVRLERALSLSYGFGGSCAALIFEAWRGH